MRYVIDSLWTIPATVTAYLISGFFFGYKWSDWTILLGFHAIATWMAIYIGPPFYRRWFTRDE